MTFKSETSPFFSSETLKTALESTQLRSWLATLAAPAPGVAPDSLRPGPLLAPSPQEQPRYYRVDAASGSGSWSGSGSGSDSASATAAGSYLVVAAGSGLPALEQKTAIFTEAGLCVPPIVATEPRLGLALMLDLGAPAYLHQLGLDSAHQLYMDAIGALLLLQSHSQPEQLPDYGRGQMQAEMSLFVDHFLGQHLKLTPGALQMTQLQKVFEAILANTGAQQTVYIHRNFQSRNLLAMPGTPGILACEGAAYGPITYDLVSLLRDAAIAWDEEMVLDWVVRYWQNAKQAGLPVDPDIDAFYRDFEMMGVQRHLMQLGLFARLAYEHGDSSHLADMPQLLEYIRKACNRYSVLKPLARLLDEWEQKQPQVGYTF